MGRSHGIHAEPTTFGLKFAGFYAEFARNRERLQLARAEIATCAISGAVGTFAHIDPSVEAHVAQKLGLQPEPVSTQVIPRDRHAMFFATLAVIASSVERLAVEIRHLQRTEVREAEEYFAPGQKGSSAMPHKRNPILSENLTGLARLVRGAVIPALENVALPLQIQGVDKAEALARARDGLAEVGLADFTATRPDKLSGGQRQRVAIARALAARPGMVIADEPTANLDSENSRMVVDLMRQMNQAHGVTFVFTTHDPRLLEHVDRKVLLRDGRIESDEVAQ